MSDIPIKTNPEHYTGWAWFDQVEADVEADRRDDGLDRSDIQLSYAAFIDSPAGQLVMQDLLRFVWASDGFRPELGFHNGAAYGFYREGMRQLVGYVQKMANDGRGKATR